MSWRHKELELSGCKKEKECEYILPQKVEHSRWDTEEKGKQNATILWASYKYCLLGEKDPEASFFGKSVRFHKML